MMNRLLALLLFTLLCIGLAACGEPRYTTETMPLNSMHNDKTGVTIFLGMTQQKVEDLLGEGTYIEPKPLLDDDLMNQYENISRPTENPDEDPYKEFAYGKEADFLAVGYYNGKATLLSSYHIFGGVEIGPSDWCAKYGLKYGLTTEDIFAHYGETKKWLVESTKNLTDKDLYYIAYQYDASGNIVDDYLLAAYKVAFWIDESNGSILTYSVESIDNTAIIEHIKEMFENKDQFNVLNSKGEDITQEFFQRHEDNYLRGDFGPILDELCEQGLTVGGDVD